MILIAKVKNLKNNYTIVDNIVYIHMKNKKGLALDTLIDLEDLDKVLQYHWNFRLEKDNQQYYTIASNVRGNRSKIIGSQCYDTETDQWVLMELDMTQPIDRYIPEWMYVEWLMRKDNNDAL